MDSFDKCILGDTIHEHIAKNARQGTIIVSNNPISSDFKKMGFEHLDRDLYVPVSWLEKQAFYVYQLA